MDAHFTVFQLRAFGQFRLPAPQTAAVVRHLAAGCRACRARAAPWLIPWLDEEPAAEARATDAALCGPALAAEYGRAARRVARAAARRLAGDAAAAADRDLRRVVTLLDREGPAAIGRLPRRLLGRPAVAALLRQVAWRGFADPRLRLRLAEIAWDLVESGGAGGRAPVPRGLAARAGIELANAHRAIGDVRAAEQWLDRIKEMLAGGGYDPAVRARLEEIRLSLLVNMSRHEAGVPQAARVARLSRRVADAGGLARSLTLGGSCLRGVGDFGASGDCHADALQLAEATGDASTVQSAAANLCLTLIDRGEWAQARGVVEGRGPGSRGAASSGRNAFCWYRCQGMLLDGEGNSAAALVAFATARAHARSVQHAHGEGHALVFAAACLERHGDFVQANRMLAEAGDIFLANQPHRELHLAATLLRIRGHFSSMRAALPLDRVGLYIDRAEHNEGMRLTSFLD